MEIALEVAHFSKRANNIILGNFAHMTVLNEKSKISLGVKSVNFSVWVFISLQKNMLVDIDNSTHNHKHLT